LTQVVNIAGATPAVAANQQHRRRLLASGGVVDLYNLVSKVFSVFLLSIFRPAGEKSITEE
jgi:hypothetical protein